MADYLWKEENQGEYLASAKLSNRAKLSFILEETKCKESINFSGRLHRC